MEYSYHPKVFEELGRFGLRPKPTTPPALAKEFVNDLYRVGELRKKYFLLSVRLELWAKVKSDI